MRTGQLLSVMAGAFLYAAGCGSVKAEPAALALATDGSAKAHASQQVTTLRAHLTRSPEGLTAERRPDGSVRVRLQGRYQSMSLRDARGRTHCVDSPEGLDRMLDAAR